jgi:hypothetical protein
VCENFRKKIILPPPIYYPRNRGNDGNSAHFDFQGLPGMGGKMFHELMETPEGLKIEASRRGGF